MRFLVSSSPTQPPVSGGIRGDFPHTKEGVEQGMNRLQLVTLKFVTFKYTDTK